LRTETLLLLLFDFPRRGGQRLCLRALLLGC
jgi:hypothetical protein